MAKGESNGRGGCGGKNGRSRGPSTHPGPGGNWPSTTGQKSGRGRGNSPAKGK